MKESLNEFKVKKQKQAEKELKMRKEFGEKKKFKKSAKLKVKKELAANGPSLNDSWEVIKVPTKPALNNGKKIAIFNKKDYSIGVFICFYFL